jgi:hypothetical protein
MQKVIDKLKNEIIGLGVEYAEHVKTRSLNYEGSMFYKKLATIMCIINWAYKKETLTAAVVGVGGKKVLPKFLEKRLINGRERNVYKLKNKLYIKTKNEWVALSEFKNK